MLSLYNLPCVASCTIAVAMTSGLEERMNLGSTTHLLKAGTKHAALQGSRCAQRRSNSLRTLRYRYGSYIFMSWSASRRRCKISLPRSLLNSPTHRPSTRVLRDKRISSQSASQRGVVECEVITRPSVGRVPILPSQSLRNAEKKGINAWRAAGVSMLRLLQLDQGPAEVLRMQEQDRLAVGADFRLAVAENARAGADEMVARQ